MADNIKDLTLETATDEVKTDEAKTDEIETVSKEDAEVESVAATKSTLLGATANSTEDIPATSFTTKTAPDGTDNLILFNQNTNVGYQIDYDNLADAILNKITSKTFSNQVGGSSAATLLSQLATLNSKTVPHTLESRELTNWWYNGNGKAEVAAGNFSNVRPGDYIIGASTGKKYWVVDLDYYYQHGLSSSFDKHHLTMMCAWNTGSKRMNETNTTEGGYVGSEMYTTHVPAVIDDFLTPDFGSNLLSFPCLLSNAVTTNVPRGNGLTGGSTNRAWSDEQAILPGEVQVYGCLAYGNVYDTGNSKQQLAMFREYGYNKVVGRDSIWLRDVASSAYFAAAYYGGGVSSNAASSLGVVRPLFVLGT